MVRGSGGVKEKEGRGSREACCSMESASSVGGFVAGGGGDDDEEEGSEVVVDSARGEKERKERRRDCRRGESIVGVGVEDKREWRALTNISARHVPTSPFGLCHLATSLVYISRLFATAKNASTPLHLSLSHLPLRL